MNKIYMCVVLVYSLTIFEKFLLDSILLTKHHVIKACSNEKRKRCNGISSDNTLLQDIRSSMLLYVSMTDVLQCKKNHSAISTLPSLFK